LFKLARAIATGDSAIALQMLAAQPDLARVLCRRRDAARPEQLLPNAIGHYVYTGDTALHVTAAAHAASIARKLIADGAEPLHRAVRTRCAAAVEALLRSGANAKLENKSGSTPRMLATMTTGRGGSGSIEAKAQRQEIVRFLRNYKA
jgi:hypothetical protein